MGNGDGKMMMDELRLKKKSGTLPPNKPKSGKQILSGWF